MLSFSFMLRDYCWTKGWYTKGSWRRNPVTHSCTMNKVMRKCEHNHQAESHCSVQNWQLSCAYKKSSWPKKAKSILSQIALVGKSPWTPPTFVDRGLLALCLHTKNHKSNVLLESGDMMKMNDHMRSDADKWLCYYHYEDFGVVSDIIGDDMLSASLTLQAFINTRQLTCFFQQMRCRHRDKTCCVSDFVRRNGQSDTHCFTSQRENNSWAHVPSTTKRSLGEGQLLQNLNEA